MNQPYVVQCKKRQTNQKDLNKSEVNWFGHVIRMNEDGILMRAYKGRFGGKGTNRKPAVTWSNRIDEHCWEGVGGQKTVCAERNCQIRGD